jgi:hypothetical protein
MIPGPNWARRYGTHHGRLCARPGCGSPAAATLRFQPTQREAWLVDLDADAPRAEGDLCARHAAALVLPRGWELHDERAVPAVPAVATADVTPLRRVRRPRPAVARTARRRTLRPELVQLPGMLAEPEPAPAPEPEPDLAQSAPEVEPAIEAVVAPPELEIEILVEIDADAGVDDSESEPEQPAPEVEDARLARIPPQLGATEVPDDGELADVLDAQTPLLQRAFRNALPK